MTKPLQVTLEGKGTVTLRPGDHIATGGEGSIYKIGNFAVKMYLDPVRMQQAGMPEKIKLLAALTHRTIVAPTGVVLNQANQPVGHYLPFVEKGHALSLVFTNDFWSKESFDNVQASKLVEGMRETVDFAHQHAALLVDANELNWFALLEGKVDPRVIDVDSWAIGKWPASVIMPSIRDWNSITFDDHSDWFAWAVVTFQIYTGLHPYKGTLAGFDRGDMIGRMKARASVFAPGVKMNRAVRDFSSIPAALLRWYEAAFQGHERSKPPSPYDSAVTAAPAARTARAVTVSGGGLLVMEKLVSELPDPVVRTFHCGVALTKGGVIIDMKTKVAIASASRDCEVVRVEDGWLIGDKGGFRHVPENRQTWTMLGLQVTARQLLSYENRMFAVTDTGLVEIKVKNFGKPVGAVGQTWGIMVNSTRWFDGFGLLDFTGAIFVIAPFGAAAVAQIRVPALDGLRVVSGKAGNRFISMIAVDKQGQYLKVELTLDREYATPPKVWTGITDSPNLNIAILPKGVCATIVRDGELNIFVPGGAVRDVQDSQIGTDMALGNWGDTVAFIKDGEVWSVRLK